MLQTHRSRSLQSRSRSRCKYCWKKMSRYLVSPSVYRYWRVIQAMKQLGTVVIGTATTVEEAKTVANCRSRRDCGSGKRSRWTPWNVLKKHYRRTDWYYGSRSSNCGSCFGPSCRVGWHYGWTWAYCEPCIRGFCSTKWHSVLGPALRAVPTKRINEKSLRQTKTPPKLRCTFGQSRTWHSHGFYERHAILSGNHSHLPDSERNDERHSPGGHQSE